MYGLLHNDSVEIVYMYFHTYMNAYIHTYIHTRLTATTRSVCHMFLYFNCPGTKKIVIQSSFMSDALSSRVSCQGGQGCMCVHLGIHASNRQTDSCYTSLHVTAYIRT